MTKVYGASDDLIEFEGDISGEVGAYGTDDDENGVLLVFDDGTLAEVKYGKAKMGIWGINVVKRGEFFHELITCEDEDASPHSDVMIFKDGLKNCFACKEWERVK